MGTIALNVPECDSVVTGYVLYMDPETCLYGIAIKATGPSEEYGC